jgi:hypothetical protein
MGLMIAVPATDRKAVTKYLDSQELDYEVGNSKRSGHSMFEIDVDKGDLYNIIADLRYKKVRAVKESAVDAQDMIEQVVGGESPGRALDEALTEAADQPMAVELKSWAIGGQDQYVTRQLAAAHKNLSGHKAKGRYKRDLAIKGMMHVVDSATKSYHKEYYHGEGKWSDIANVATRKLAAEMLVDDFEEQSE